MASSYYQPCEELNRCEQLDYLWETEQYEKWFQGYLAIAEDTHYALAECQVGFAYMEGIGVEKDLEKALYWSQLSAEHGDRDGQFNLAYLFEEGLLGQKDLDKAKYWYRQSAMQNHDLAIQKCEELEIDYK